MFIQEAEGYLKILRSPHGPPEEQRRAAHGLKRAAGLVGLVKLAAIADQLREQLRCEPGQGRSEALKHALDQAETVLGDLTVPTPEPPDEEPWDQETARLLLAVFTEEAREHVESLTSVMLALEQGDSEETAEQIRGLLRIAHTLKGSAATVGQDEISRGAHQLEELLAWIARAPQSAVKDRGLADLLIQTSDVLGAMVTAAETGQPCGGMLEELEELAELVRGRLAAPPAEEEGRAVGSTSERRHGDRRGDERRWEGRRQKDPPLIKVDPARLDQLMDQGGELLIHRTRLERRVEELRALSVELAMVRRQLHSALSDTRGPGHRDIRQRLTELEVDLADRAANLERGTSSLADDCEALRRTSQSLRGQLGRLYLTPISLLHARLKRPLREMARAQGKQLELVIIDEASEMPRSIVEQITAPLIQLLRNAVVHGIEAPAQRIAGGKPPTGRVEVTVRHRGDVVYLEVSDDGAGVDPETVRQALRRRGNLSSEDLEHMSDEDLLDSIFLSGFSTREEPDQLAGRGVGLDVVRQHIGRLGGDIRLSSELGQGTRFFIQMPLTTATAQALLFKAGDLDFGLPLAHVDQVLIPSPEQVEQEGQAMGLRIKGTWLPLLSLGRLMGTAPPAPRKSEVPKVAILIRLGELRFGIACSRVVGTREIVLKGLGSLLAPHPLLAAATVRSDSSVTFVLDVAFLARAAAMAHQAAIPAPSGGGSGRGSGPSKIGAEPRLSTILLADDSRSVREAVGHLLRTMGYQVDLAVDGREAWEKLRQGPYGLLLTDLEMPEIHGLELIARCRGESSLREMPIVVLTSRSSADSRLEALKRGAESFLAKPVSKKVLQEQLEGLLP